MEQREWKWFIEWFTSTSARMHGVKEVLYSGRTKYQTVEIVVTYEFGKCLFLDGKLQSSEYDEAIYHEALVHPVMLAHGDPRHVLIIGGGEGATLREVLKYKCVEEAVMVDIDGEVVELCKKYLPEWSRGAFDDPRAKLIIGDGRRFLKETDKRFDVVIIDVTDPLAGGPSALLYTVEFYRLVRSRLNPDGVMVTQATTPYVGKSALNVYAVICSTLMRVFNIVRPYYTDIPSFEGSWGFVAASDKVDPASLSPDEIDKRIKEMIKGELKTYDGGRHQRMFILPKDVKLELKRYEDKVATDESPVYMPA